MKDVCFCPFFVPFFVSLQEDDEGRRGLLRGWCFLLPLGVVVPFDDCLLALWKERVANGEETCTHHEI